MNLRALFWNYMDDTWVSHIALSLVEHMQAPDFEVRLVSHASSPQGRRTFTEDGVSPLLAPLVYRLDSQQRLVHHWTCRRFLRDLDRSDAVYLWPGAPLDVYRKARELGLPIFVERINTHRAFSATVLSEEYARAGLAPDAHGITPAQLDSERRKLALTDYAFAPSPMVAKSLADHGFDPSRVIPTTYGWSPERMRIGGTVRSSQRFTVLFLGTLCVRKGVHRLLRAWERAGVDGELWLAGEMADVALVPGVRGLLEREDVRLLGHATDVAPVYANADVFAFPSFEEGSPLVSYEAMAHGLPMLVSPIAAGEVVRPNVDGLVCAPDDEAGWVAALQRLAGDEDLRRRLGESAAQRVQEFTWARTAARRREAVQARMATVLG